MPGEYGCAGDACQRNPNWLITHLNPPATLSVCDEEFPVFIIPLLAGELGVDAQRLYDTIKRFTDREAAREAKEAATATPPRSPIPTDEDLGFEAGEAGPDRLAGTGDGSVSGEGITVTAVEQ